MVGMGHLLLDFEIASVTKALENEVGVELVGGVNSQTVERLDTHGGQVGQAGPNHCDSLVDGEDARWFRGVVHRHNGDPTEELDTLLDNIDMAKMQRIEAARVQHAGHG